VIALTGATGFLGSHIADALMAAGHAVRVAVRPTSNRRWLEGKDLEVQVVDLLDDLDCERFLSGTNSLVHCAGVVSAPNEITYRRGNVETTAHLLTAARKVWGDRSSTTFLLVSSLAAHGPAGLLKPAVEANDCAPISAYGRSKLAAEELVRQTAGAFRRVVLRPPSLYGPRDREFLPLLRAAARGWTVRPGPFLSGLSLVDGRDAATAVVSLLDTPPARGTFFISDAQVGYNWDQIQAALAGAVGRRVRRLNLPAMALRLAVGAARLSGASPLLLNPDRLRDLTAPGWVCDGRLLTRATGFQTTRTAESGFRETLNFYRKHQWL